MCNLLFSIDSRIFNFEMHKKKKLVNRYILCNWSLIEWFNVVTHQLWSLFLLSKIRLHAFHFVRALWKVPWNSNACQSKCMNYSDHTSVGNVIRRSTLTYCHIRIFTFRCTLRQLNCRTDNPFLTCVCSMRMYENVINCPKHNFMFALNAHFALGIINDHKYWFALFMCISSAQLQRAA